MDPQKAVEFADLLITTSLDVAKKLERLKRGELVDKKSAEELVNLIAGFTSQIALAMLHDRDDYIRSAFRMATKKHLPSTPGLIYEMSPRDLEGQFVATVRSLYHFDALDLEEIVQHIQFCMHLFDALSARAAELREGQLLSTAGV